MCLRLLKPIGRWARGSWRARYGRVLDSRVSGGRFLLRVTGKADSLLARSRIDNHVFRVGGLRHRRGSTTAFSLAINHLLPRGAAQATLDLYLERGSSQRRIVAQSGFRGTVSTHEGIDTFQFRTAPGNLSLSLLRTAPRRPIRVVVLLQQLNYSGGKTTAQFKLASMLRAAGFEVSLTALWLTSTPAVYGPPSDVTLGYVDAQMLQAAGEEPLRINVPEFTASRRTDGRLRSYFANLAADVVYLPDFDSPLYRVLNEALPPHIVTILGDHDGERYAQALIRGAVPTEPERNRYFAEAIHTFDAVHVLNPKVFDAYTSSTSKPVICIPNALGSRDDITDFLNYRRIVAAGRLTPLKGLETLVRAFAAIRDEHPAWAIDIYGQGESRAMLQQLIDELALGTSVVLRDPSPTLVGEMTRSSLHVTASTAESFGLTMAEAMSVGLPVLSHHRNAGAAYLLEEGRGFIAEEGTVDSLALKMNEILGLIESGDPDRIIQRSVDAARAFITGLSDEIVAEMWKFQIERLYERKLREMY